MISKILITVFSVVILLGLLGLRSKTIGKKLFFACISAFGGILLAFTENNMYGIVGGTLQLVFRLVAGIALVIWIRSICYKNGIQDLTGIQGIGRQVPYSYAAAVLFAVVLTGFPGGGAFTGLLYSEIGMLAGGFGFAVYFGLIGNACSILIPGILLFQILRPAYFYTEESEPLRIAGPSKKMAVLFGILAIAMIVFCIYQKPVLLLAEQLVKVIKG